MGVKHIRRGAASVSVLDDGELLIPSIPTSYVTGVPRPGGMNATVHITPQVADDLIAALTAARAGEAAEVPADV
jgi:hypothetical protein